MYGRRSSFYILLAMYSTVATNYLLKRIRSLMMTFFSSHPFIIFYIKNSKSGEAYPLEVDTLGGTSSGLVPHELSFRPRVSSKTPPSRKNKWENQFLV